MSKIIDGYNQWVVSNGTVFTLTEINDEDLDDMDNLKSLIKQNGIYSVKAYDEFIEKIKDNFEIKKCIECGFFRDELVKCDSCGIEICKNHFSEVCDIHFCNVCDFLWGDNYE